MIMLIYDKKRLSQEVLMIFFITCTGLYEQNQHNLYQNVGNNLLNVLFTFFLYIFISTIQFIQSINKTMSKTNIYSLKIYQDHEKKSFFLRDSKFDFLLALNNEFFPIHQTILDKSCFLTNSMKDHQGSKIYFLLQDFSKKTFINILASLYGYLLSFEGNQEVQEILEIAYFLQISELKTKICQHLLQKFESYDLIFLYKLSKKFSLQELFQKCLEQLIFYNYEHLHINKFELLMSDKSIVAEFISEYLILKSKNIVPKGPSDEKIKNFALQYNALNQNSLDIYQIYLNSVFDQIAIQKLMMTFQKISESERLISAKIQVNQLAKRNNTDMQSEQKQDQKINQIMKLNSEIYKRSKSVCEEIKKISEEINNTQSQNQSCELQEISKKMRQFEQDFNNQETRLRKLSLDLRRSSNFKNFSQSSKTCRSQ